MGSTNYIETFIQVAEDCPADRAIEPPAGGKAPTVASLQHALITERPYELTSDDVLFKVHAMRQNIADESRERARAEFLAKSQACLRASPLGKRYGWGIHHDADGRVALVPLGSTDYARLATDPDIKQLKAMRSKRASKADSS